MPTETVLGLCAIFAVFAFFAGVVVFGDLTWKERPHRRRPG